MEEEKNVNVLDLKSPLKLNLHKPFEIEYRINTDNVDRWEVVKGSLCGIQVKKVKIHEGLEGLEREVTKDILLHKVSLPIGKWIVKNVDYHEITLVRDI